MVIDMLQILNLEEAKTWSEKNLYETDSFMFPLDVAVKRGKFSFSHSLDLAEGHKNKR